LVSSPVAHGATLLKAMDATVSPMGARMLRRWILMPLVNKEKIQERLDLVEKLLGNTDGRSSLLNALRNCGDVERLVSKIPSRKIGPREMLQLAKTLQTIAEIQTLSAGIEDDYFSRLNSSLDPCSLIRDRIFQEIQQDPPAQTQKGGYMAIGLNEELDYYRNLATGGKNILLEIQQREAVKTCISSLKIGFNNVFGYYLEVSNAHKDKVPADWIRKQTLTNGERYITPELKEYEEKILGAEEKLLQLESMLYEKLVASVQEYILPLQQNAHVLAILDCLCSFSLTAEKNGYRKPVIQERDTLELRAARHPVIEQLLPLGEKYIDNDLVLDRDTCQVIILTGPNMSGKSALLRQTALITLMAHMGSYVPAAAAQIPLTDKIFTRVGASDNLSGGESTFMVEMNETASIINNISPRSLVILDEIGRGTSTYDGISIATSIAEFLHDAPQKPKTLFATHYHEMNDLEFSKPRIRNFHITHKEVDRKIIFLRKLAAGGSTHSFGIHVARMAGMPQSLIKRAEQLLKQLEKNQTGLPQESTAAEWQLSIFDTHTEVFSEIRKLLDATDINGLTPVEALVMLSEIKKKLG
jgi:DNA mismatch repair protein MutS